MTIDARAAEASRKAPAIYAYRSCFSPVLVSDTADVIWRLILDVTVLYVPRTPDVVPLADTPEINVPFKSSDMMNDLPRTCETGITIVCPAAISPIG